MAPDEALSSFANAEDMGVSRGWAALESDQGKRSKPGKQISDQPSPLAGSSLEEALSQGSFFTLPLGPLLGTQTADTCFGVGGC